MSEPMEDITTCDDDINVSQLTESSGFRFDPSFRCSNDDDLSPENSNILTTDSQLGDEDEEQVAEVPGAPKKARITFADGSSVSDLTTTTISTPSPSLQGAIESCAANYEANEQNKGVLLAMCIGLHKDNPKFAVYTEDPNYKDRRQRSQFKTTKKMLLDEVQRRHKLVHGPKALKPCKSFNNTQLIAHLVKYPVFGTLANYNWLIEKEEEFRKELDDAEAERKESGDLHSKDEDAWLGNLPWLRLYHVIISDRVKPSYMHVNDWEGRDGIDSRNSDKHPKSFFEVCAEVYNDPDFSVITRACPELHADFAKPIDVPQYDPQIPHVTADKIKKKLGEARARLMKMIANWELSGNGSGQRSGSDGGFGHVSVGQKWRNVNQGDNEEEFMDGDNRASFLYNRMSHLLYLWDLFDKNDLLDHTLNKFDASVSAVAGSVPPTNGQSNKTIEKKATAAKERSEMLEVQAQVSQAMKSVASVFQTNSLVTLERHLFFMEDKLNDPATVGSAKETLQSQVNRTKRRIEDLYAKMGDE